jgi:hypothetical protein
VKSKNTKTTAKIKITMMSGIYKIPTIIPRVAQLMFRIPISFNPTRIITIGIMGIVMANLFLELVFIF